MAVGMPNEGMPPNLGQNQQSFQMAMQQSQPPQNMPNRPQNGQPPLSQADAALIQDLTQQLMNQVSQENKNRLRAELQARMDPATYQRYQAQGLDPVFMYYRNQAVGRVRQDKQARMAQAQQQGQLAIGGPPPQNVPTTAPPMQQQRSMNPSPLNGQAQPPTTAAGNPDFSFMGNMGNLIDQQQQGVMAQEAGQMVVPASSAQRNATPQPAGVMPGQQMGMNDPRRAANPNLRAQQQQQMFAQQQHQRMQQTAQQQSQAAARANAQAKAQQIGLQGQPGGMGSGPMPPQQSPAMGTLNAPLRTPSQQASNAEPAQVGANAQFGQALDPRFMQGNQRQPSGNAMSMMLAGMTPEQQQRLAQLPPDKLNEIVSKWHEQSAMNAGNGQPGRPQMPMQANSQIRPGQQGPQPGQFNPQALSQFMLAHPGQRPPPSLTAGMTAQQQQMFQLQLQQRMHQNPAQQRTVPPITPIEQRAIMQMDNMDIPPPLLNHQQMPRGIPQDIKKWGVLKQWAQVSLPAEAQEAIRTLQRVHYQGILQARQSSQPMGLPNRMPGNQAAGPMGPAGISAPVAPMGQNPMQMANGMNIGPGQLRQPTQQDIQNARNHPSGKMASLTDEQIRTVLLRNQASAKNQLQQKQNAMLQMQMANQMTPMDGQQPRPGMPPGQGQLGGPAMGVAQKGPQSKQMPPVPEQAPSSATTNPRSARPQTAGRATGQNSSPAQPAKNLKRTSSDDVIEVPNPNGPQSSALQQNQAKAPTQAPPRLTEQQIAALTPEDKKKYEQAQRMFQANRGAPTEMEQLRTIMQEEAQRRDPLPDIVMDAETKQTMLTLLRSIQVPLANVGRAVPRWFQFTRDVARARMFFRAVSILFIKVAMRMLTRLQRHRLLKQFKDVEMTQPRDTFSIQPSEVEQARVMLSSMVKDLSDRFPKMKKPEGAQAQPTSAAQPAQPPAATTAPLNAANLQQQQQQLNKMNQRAGNRTTQAPAAPTSTQPPFQFGATSPHGAAKYSDTTPPLTQENLHLPARKKQRPNSNAPAQGTPGSNASPRTSKPVSPDVKRQQVPDTKPKPSLSCPEPECERLQLSFDTQEALKNHTEQEHVRPLADPAKYAHDKLASILEWDTQKSKKPEGPTPTPTPTTAKGATPKSKGETTPAADATPINHQVSMSRQGTASGKGAEPSKANVADQKTPGKPVAKETDPWAENTIDPLAIFQNIAPESGALGAISDMSVYRSITPNDTPESSKDGISEPNSDVSEGVALDINLDIFGDDNWQPFGGSDADFLADMTSFNSQSQQELAVLDDDPSLVFTSWDDMVDPTAFDKPFQFDSSLFSMSTD